MMKNYDIRQRCIIKQKKIAFTEDDFQFTQITNHNVGQFPLIRKLYPDYKIQVLKHQGESPYGRKIFRAQFNNVIAQVSEQHGTVRDIFIAMHVEGELIGFALIKTNSNYLSEYIGNSYHCGSVGEFFIVPKYRRKGYGRILNDRLEKIFAEENVNTVSLTPDPVTGKDFWRAMGYQDTGLNKGLGRPLIFRKHLRTDETSAAIDKAIQENCSPVGMSKINPYNKAQLVEMVPVWKEYCAQNYRKYHKREIRKTAFEARKNKSIHFSAVYCAGKIEGFILKKDDEQEIRYITDRIQQEKTLLAENWETMLHAIKKDRRCSE